MHLHYDDAPPATVSTDSTLGLQGSGESKANIFGKRKVSVTSYRITKVFMLESDWAPLSE